MENIKCVGCGANVEVGALKCPYCGTPYVNKVKQSQETIQQKTIIEERHYHHYDQPKRRLSGCLLIILFCTFPPFAIIYLIMHLAKRK